MSKVIIEVSGGVAYLVNAPEGIEVEIRDLDNEREGKMDKWLADLQENGDDGTGFCDMCAGCPNCVSEGESNE